MKRSLALATLTAIALTACQPAAPDTGAEPIKLGVIAPLTGDAASLGSDVLNGMRMAIDRINADGGIDGVNVALVAEDGRCTGSEAANAAQKLVNVNKVVAIVGGVCSSETLAMAPIAEAGKVVVVSPTSSSPDVTNAGTFIFRNYPSDALKTKAIASLFKDKGWKKIAILTENTDFSMAFRDSLKKDLGADAVVFDEVVEPGTKDFRTLMTRLKGQQFDVFFPNANGDAVMAPMIQQFRAQGMKQQILSHDVADSLTLGDIATEEVEGMYVVNVPTAGDGTDFETAFEALYGKPQSSIAFAAHAYDAGLVLAQVMREVGADGTKIRDALLALPDYAGIVGTFHFDENGDVVGVPYVLKQFKAGVPEVVETIEM